MNRDTKTSGGIKSFASNKESILKWALNRPYQAENTKALYEMAGIKRSTEDYKCTFPSEIIKSERRVAKVKEVLAKDFLSPSDPTLDQEYLFNIGFGIPVHQGLADGILVTKERGENLYKTFPQNRILSTKDKMHDPTKRQEKVPFENSGKKVTLKKNGKEKIIVANRKIIGTMLALSAKHYRLINFKTALQLFFP